MINDELKLAMVLTHCAQVDEITEKQVVHMLEVKNVLVGKLWLIKSYYRKNGWWLADFQARKVAVFYLNAPVQTAPKAILHDVANNPDRIRTSSETSD